MLNKQKLLIIINLTFILLTPLGLSAQSSGTVCIDNDYALCSHAQCGCYDEAGNSIDCEAYSKDAIRAGWSRCECPIVKNSGSVYDANYAALNCKERQKPSKLSHYKLPPFVDETTDIYSTYSFGDSLPDTSFGTDESDSALICNKPDLFADCLNIACYIPEGSDNAICYCKNRSVKEECPSLAWNTFGGDCNSGNCSLGKQEVWSAACIQPTMSAISQVFTKIRESGLDPQFKGIATYCKVTP